MNEFTVTFTAEVTAIFHDQAGVEEVIMTDEFKDKLGRAILASVPYHHDVHVKDVKVFISKEGVEE